MNPSVYYDKTKRLWHSRIYVAAEKRYIHVGRLPTKDIALEKATQRIADLLNPPSEKELWRRRSVDSLHHIAAKFGVRKVGR